MENVKLKGFPPPKKISEWLNNLLAGIGGVYATLKLATVFIVFIFGALFSKDFISNFKSLRKNESIQWMLGLVMGGVFAVITYSLFWTGLVIFGMFVIFKTFARGLIKF